MRLVSSEIAIVCRDAVEAAMNVVSQYQRLGPRPDTFPHSRKQKMKPDGTLATLAVDQAAADAGMGILSKLSGVAISCEEKFNAVGIPGGLTGDLSSDLVIDFDPCDGSMGMALHSWTSTVILTVRSVSLRRQLLAIIGHPVSGEVYIARDGEQAFAVTQKLPMWEEDTRALEVSDSDIGRTTRILVDSYPGFQRAIGAGRKTVFSTDELNQLHTNIQAEAGICAFGSNGLHDAIVAAGGPAAVGSITTAIGGYWDLPVLMVLQAGGCAAAFRVEPDNSLTWCESLDVTGYDILCVSNKPGNLERIVGMVRRAKGQ